MPECRRSRRAGCEQDNPQHDRGPQQRESLGDVTVNVESQVRNETDAVRNVTLSVEIFDAATGTRVTTFQGSAAAVGAGQTAIVKASGPLASAKLWSDLTPNLYDVVTSVAADGTTLHWTSESIITGDSTTKAAIWRLDIWKNVYTIQNKDSAHSRYAGYASIHFSDSNADGRQMSSEVARASGKVDAVRLPKQLYFAHRVVGNPQPDVHIIGHWTYPAGTRKTRYIVANTPQVELFVNGTSIGKSSTPTDHYLFSFPNVSWASGTVRAVGYDASGKQVASHELETVGAATSLKLTATTSPNGLQADGADVVMIDFEVVDAAGQRVPTDEARVDFSMTGPGVWRGGYNSGIPGSTNNMYLSTEAGINRVFVRASLTPGTITVTATRSSLASASVSVMSNAVPVVDGLR
jgi:beta-galactosidase